MSAVLQQLTVGIRSRVPYDEYAALPGTSITRLKEIGRSPLHYAYRLEHPKESKALQLGTAAHTAVLEPERFDRQFAIWDRRSEKTGNLCPRNGQFYEAFVAANPGKEIITADEHAVALAIQAAVRSHSVAAHYLSSGEPEVTMQWIQGGRPRKGRVDWFTRIAPWNNKAAEPVATLVGLKTSRDCRHFRFGAQAGALGYHMQWGWYFDGYEFIKHEHPRVVEIVVESDAPHAVKVYSIPQDVIDQGRDDYQKLALILEECEDAGHFPGPGEIEEPLSLPTYMYEKSDDLGDLELE